MNVSSTQRFRCFRPFHLRFDPCDYNLFVQPARVQRCDELMASQDHVKKYMIDLLGGGVGGSLSTIVGQPLDTIKVRLQIQQRGQKIFDGPWDCLKKTVRHEGFRGFFKGLSPPLSAAFFLNAIVFSTNAQFKSLLNRLAGRSPYAQGGLLQTVAAAELTAPIYCLFLCPVDLVKNRLQIQTADPANRLYTGPLDCLIKTVRQEGITGIYRGFAATLATRLVGLPVYFGGYETARNWLGQRGEMSLWKVAVSGSVGGALFWTTVYPIDLVKTRLQTQRAGERSMLSAAKDIIRQGGLAGFYRGFAPCLLRSFPAYAMMFLGYEWTVHLLWA
eukprot:TRINITY_DN1204_c0_g1_i1.p1 TRINITY_DN1204_c0_g1~~TRINITY_DN1204_c0_g1_i1.p1  ORF type:complete len:331 (-),score=-19.47 TRINITY_DN1204_c0_g1_i1:141-1133(-)